MLISLVTYLLISNALTLRKDKSILFFRIVMVSLILTSILAFNNLFVIGSGESCIKTLPIIITVIFTLIFHKFKNQFIILFYIISTNITFIIIIFNVLFSIVCFIYNLSFLLEGYILLSSDNNNPMSIERLLNPISSEVSNGGGGGGPTNSGGPNNSGEAFYAHNTNNRSGDDRNDTMVTDTRQDTSNIDPARIAEINQIGQSLQDYVHEQDAGRDPNIPSTHDYHLRDVNISAKYDRQSSTLASIRDFARLYDGGNSEVDRFCRYINRNQVMKARFFRTGPRGADYSVIDALKDFKK